VVGPQRGYIPRLRFSARKTALAEDSETAVSIQKVAGGVVQDLEDVFNIYCTHRVRGKDGLREHDTDNLSGCHLKSDCIRPYTTHIEPIPKSTIIAKNLIDDKSN
jgi:hypothetical protein